MDYKRLVTDVAIDLFSRKKRGNTGEIAYQNGGGALFENFVQANRDYYLYHGEIDHIRANAKAIAHTLNDVEHAIIIGPGPATSFENKECQILQKLPRLKAVSLIDLRSEFNDSAEEVLRSDVPPSMQRRVKTIEKHCMDFRDAAPHISEHGKVAVFLTGGLVTNVPNAPPDGFPDQDLEDMLGKFRELAGDNGYVVLGYDTNQSPDSLKKAYDASLGKFIVNIMQIIKDHCEGINGFDASSGNFRYEMEWNRKASQVGHKIVFTKPQKFTITVDGKTHNFSFDEDDELLMISSLKPSQQKMTQLASNCSLATVNGYFDKHGLVEHVLKSVPRKAPANSPPPSDGLKLA